MVPDFNNMSPAAEDDRFDRLADGELSEAQRRQLLLSLDQEPDGWRRCALAFLEAQCWKQELGEFRQSVPAAAVKPLPLAQTAGRRASPFGLLGTLMAMAACFLLVLGTGLWWQQGGRQPGGITASAPLDQLAGSKTGPQSATILAESPSATPWQMVRFAPAGSTDSDQAVQLPAIQRASIDEQWLKSLPHAIPEQVLQTLRRNGYQVQTQQELMPLPLKDGRRLVLPVDQVDIKYIGNRTY